VGGDSASVDVVLDPVERKFGSQEFEKRLGDVVGDIRSEVWDKS